MGLVIKNLNGIKNKKIIVSKVQTWNLVLCHNIFWISCSKCVDSSSSIQSQIHRNYICFKYSVVLGIVSLRLHKPDDKALIFLAFWASSFILSAEEFVYVPFIIFKKQIKKKNHDMSCLKNV